MGYVRWRLRRKLFVSFGLAILITGLVTGLAAWTFGGARWSEQVERVEAFVGHRFAEVWDDPAAREKLASQTAADLGVGIVLRDAEGTELTAFGPTCKRPYVVNIRRDAEPVGVASVCAANWRGARSGFWFSLLLGGVALWVVAGFIAVRVTRPLAELVRVTTALGEGRLAERVSYDAAAFGELGVVADAVNEMATRVEGMVTTERELLAAVSHEIRTPLGHMRVLLDMARQSNADESVVAELESEIVAIDDLVTRLLARSRIDFGNVARQPTDAVKLALRALERAGLSPTLLDAEAETLPFRGDDGLLLAALANLLRNAADHAEGVTVLRVARRDGAAVFEVDDRGPGFDPTELDRAFARFHQGPQSGPRGGSLGLGLALVDRIAKAHGGAAVAKNIDGGARVGFSASLGLSGD